MWPSRDEINYWLWWSVLIVNLTRIQNHPEDKSRFDFNEMGRSITNRKYNSDSETEWNVESELRTGVHHCFSTAGTMRPATPHSRHNQCLPCYGGRTSNREQTLPRVAFVRHLIMTMRRVTARRVRVLTLRAFLFKHRSLFRALSPHLRHLLLLFP